MDPIRVPGFENCWLNALGEAFELSDGVLVPLPISKSSQYPRVSVPVGGKRIRHHLHVLMALTFLGLDPSKRGTSSDSLQVDHKDGDKNNNRLENLEIVTKRENYRRAHANGCYAGNGYASKGRPKLSLRRFTEDDIAHIHRLRSEGLSYREIGRRMKCDHKAVYRILKGDVYKSWN